MPVREPVRLHNALFLFADDPRAGEIRQRWIDRAALNSKQRADLEVDLDWLKGRLRDKVRSGEKRLCGFDPSGTMVFPHPLWCTKGDWNIDADAVAAHGLMLKDVWIFPSEVPAPLAEPQFQQLQTTTAPKAENHPSPTAAQASDEPPVSPSDVDARPQANAAPTVEAQAALPHERIGMQRREQAQHVQVPLQRVVEWMERYIKEFEYRGGRRPAAEAVKTAATKPIENGGLNCTRPKARDAYKRVAADLRNRPGRQLRRPANIARP